MMKNGEGYHDPTAGQAIRRADRVPKEITEMIAHMRYIAELNGYEITGRIKFKDKKTGRIYH